MAGGGVGGQDAFYKWLKTYLKDRGLQFSKSGFKGGDDMAKHVVDETTGFWQNVSYSQGKPPRWLFNINVAVATISASLPAGLQESGIGGSNTAQGDKAGLAVRILPIFKKSDNDFEAVPDFEVQAFFLFHGALKPIVVGEAAKGGTSSDSFTMNTSTGAMKRLGVPQEYIFAALLGLRPRSDVNEVEVNGTTRTVNYGSVLDALQSAIMVCPSGASATPIALYDLTDDAELDKLKADLTEAWNNAGPPPGHVTAAAASVAVDDDDSDGEETVEAFDASMLEVPENPDLLGIDPAVYRQINAMLQSGKQHLMLYGPPGTGKTSLARWIANSLPGGKWTLITGSSDWSSQDIIGGYQPIGGGDVDFVPGILLRAFDQPLIIDELNRCDIDKVIGPLFTVLSGQQTTLPYRTELSNKDSQPYVILPQPKVGAADHEFAPGPAWRLLATINSIDKASLYQMSYALSRRFGWVYVDAPTDLREFVRSFLTHLDPAAPEPAGDAACPLADLWRAINAVRVIGPAPIIDAIKAIRVLDPTAAFFGPANDAMRLAALDALDMVLLPMLDGIVHQDAMAIADTAVAAFSLPEGQARQVRARLESVAI